MLDAVPSHGAGTLAAFVPLASELCDLKRIRDARSRQSVAGLLFRNAWASLAAGLDPLDVALTATAEAVTACRLGRMDAAFLNEAGLQPDDALHVRTRAFAEVAAPLDPALADSLRAKLGRALPGGRPPPFVNSLMRQPRAGATCPGKPRIILEPPENHGEHCLVVAVLAVLLAPRYGADPAATFLAGMAHHLHNAAMPDSGFAGEVLLGDHLGPIMTRLFDRELATLTDALRTATRAALDAIKDASTPVGQAFHAADVMDRVLEMRHFHEVAGFTIDQALEDMDLVHAGPTQAFHMAVLQDAGLP